MPGTAFLTTPLHGAAVVLSPEAASYDTAHNRCVGLTLGSLLIGKGHLSKIFLFRGMQMLDIAYCGVAVVFFVLSVAYVWWLEGLKGGNRE